MTAVAFARPRGFDVAPPPSKAAKDGVTGGFSTQRDLRDWDPGRHTEQTRGSLWGSMRDYIGLIWRRSHQGSVTVSCFPHRHMDVYGYYHSSCYYCNHLLL